MGQAGLTTLGLQAKPVIPFSFFDPVTQVGSAPLYGEVELTAGFAFGMVVRTGISKSISFETGINQITRRYSCSIVNDTLGYREEDRLRYVGYEIPAMAMVYIRLGERSWMNNALGFSADLYPSDAERILEQSRIYFARTNWLRMGVVANIGLEYRTLTSGWFYLGATYHRPFDDVAVAELTWYDADDIGHTIKSGVAGDYLTVDIRYFFHADPERKQRRRSSRSDE